MNWHIILSKVDNYNQEKVLLFKRKLSAIKNSFNIFSPCGVWVTFSQFSEFAANREFSWLQLESQLRLYQMKKSPPNKSMIAIAVYPILVRPGISQNGLSEERNNWIWVLLNFCFHQWSISAVKTCEEQGNLTDSNCLTFL